jgi:hypothetical protein
MQTDSERRLHWFVFWVSLPGIVALWIVNVVAAIPATVLFAASAWTFLWKREPMPPHNW